MPRIWNDFKDGKGNPVPRNLKMRGDHLHWEPNGFLDLDPITANNVCGISKFFRREIESGIHGEHKPYHHNCSDTMVQRKNGQPITFAPGATYRLTFAEYQFFRRKGIKLEPMKKSEDKDDPSFTTALSKYNRLKRIAATQFNVVIGKTSTLSYIKRAMAEFDEDEADKVLKELGYVVEETDEVDD